MNRIFTISADAVAFRIRQSLAGSVLSSLRTRDSEQVLRYTCRPSMLQFIFKLNEQKARKVRFTGNVAFSLLIRKYGMLNAMSLMTLFVGVVR